MTVRAAGATAPRPVSEAAFQQAVIDLARALGWRVYHTHDSRHSAAGYPDLTLVRGGRLVFAELKAQAGRLSDVQRCWLQELEIAGAQAFVWRPSDWRVIEEVLGRGTLPVRPEF